jgi:hypothetical protein
MFNPLPQITVNGRIKENSVGSEVLCFNIKLGALTLVCIANIPDEDQDEAPVYVKFKVNTRRGRDHEDLGPDSQAA